MSARPVFLVLDGPVRKYFKLPADPRKWLPGQTHMVDMIAEIPASIPRGKYALSLWLPDEAPSLQKDPRYAIQLANDGLWQATSGFNRMIEGMQVR